MGYTKGQWLRQHLSDLVADVTATERSDQPLFNKGLEVKCAIDTKLEKILNHKEVAPAMHEALEVIQSWLEGRNKKEIPPNYRWEIIDKALALASG